MEWIEQFNRFLSDSREFYFYLALGGSAVFVLQVILMLIGIGGAEDADSTFDPSDVDLGGPGELSFVSFFSLRSIVAFLAFFGWAGFFWGGMGIGGLVIAVFCGLVMMVLTTLIVWLFIRMQQSGNLETADFIGQTGSVYLGIPAGRMPGGMVTVRFAGCTRQVKAIADAALSSGTPVKVVEAVGHDCYVVEKI